MTEIIKITDQIMFLRVWTLVNTVLITLFAIFMAIKE